MKLYEHRIADKALRANSTYYHHIGAVDSPFCANKLLAINVHLSYRNHTAYQTSLYLCIRFAHKQTYGHKYTYTLWKILPPLSCWNIYKQITNNVSLKSTQLQPAEQSKASKQLQYNIQTSERLGCAVNSDKNGWKAKANPEQNLGER